jgi:hypothetical protein
MDQELNIENQTNIMNKINLLKNKIIKRIITAILLIVMILSTLGIIYNFKNQNGIANYQIYSYLKKENPTFGLGIIRSEIVEFDQKNSMSNYLSPIYTLILETENFKGGYVINYSRGFPLQEIYIKNKESVKSFTIKDDKKSFENIVKLAKEKNISTVDNTDEIYTGKQKEGFDLTDDYFDGVKVDKSKKLERGKLIKDYSIVIPDTSVSNFSKLLFRLDLLTTGPTINHKLWERQTVLFDPEYPNAKFIAISFTNGYSDKSADNSFLKSIYIIKKDRTIIEIPIVDGKFDWKLVDGELKK